jgi:hypothetical protein
VTEDETEAYISKLKSRRKIKLTLEKDFEPGIGTKFTNF